MKRPPSTSRHDTSHSPASDSEAFSFPLPPRWLGWAAATCFLFAALFFAAKSFNVRGQLQSVLEAERIARLEAGTLKNILEAERILSRGQLDRLAAAEQTITDLQATADLARLQLVPLAPGDNNETSPIEAIVLWHPDRQEGILVAARLPAPPAGYHHRLWLTTPDSATPVDVGALPVTDSPGEIRVRFKPDQNVPTFQSFTITSAPIEPVLQNEPSLSVTDR